MARSGRSALPRGGGGNASKGGPQNTGRGRGICFQYKKHGTCKFGNDCRYAHEVDSTQGSKSDQQKQRFEETPEQSDARFKYNTWKRLVRKQPQINDIGPMIRLWDGALDILNSNDRDSRQSLAKDLDRDENQDDYGRHHIKALMEHRAQAHNHNQFIQASRYFLLVMTHTAMLDCLSVDTYVSSLYNFMSGANGRRAVSFLLQLCEALVATCNDPDSAPPPEIFDSTLVVLSIALTKLLRRESRARFNEDLPGLLDALDNAAPLIMHEDSAVSADKIAGEVAMCRAMVARAHGLLVEESEQYPKNISSAANQSSYPRSIVTPGGRHDNDHADITKISLFPTRDEILTDSREFLPSIDPDQLHHLANKIERHIDTQFRLLRHDTFGMMKDALGGVLDNIIHDHGQITNPRIHSADTRMNSYPNAFIKYLVFTRRDGFHAQFSFLQPRALRGKSSTDWRRWWDDSNRLESGVLLSFIWLEGSAVQHIFLTVKRNVIETHNQHKLPHDDRIATVTVKLATEDSEQIMTLLGLSQQRTRGLLLEFPRMLPDTFVPILECLQDMQSMGTLQFGDWVLPERAEGTAKDNLAIPPPLYARSPGFAFSLAPVITGPGQVTLSPSEFTHSLAELETNTGLDHGQCEALVAALTREFAFIQGPPGTGKSFLGVKLMQVLLESNKKADLGPIVVLSYTNHALDQFLEHLIHGGIKKVVRVGGRSASDLLENHNLRSITRQEVRSKHDKWRAAVAYQKLDELEESSGGLLDRLHSTQKSASWKYLKSHISQDYSGISSQFKQVDDEGFTRAGRHPFDIWLSGTPSDEHGSTPATPNIDSIIRKAKQDVHCLSNMERRMLIGRWMEELQQDAMEEFVEMLREAEEAQCILANVHNETDRCVLQDAEVIGLTTSGLAKNISTLRHVRAKVVICEEAGEVLEPHIVCALLPSVEHFIQIGDHQQLRPSISNFRDLSLESDRGKLHQLDRSQFERLSIGEQGRPSMPVAQLKIQRRMRPDISVLVRQTIYDRLLDHESTLQLPDVVGMRKNVFWLDHQNLENTKEAEVHHKKSHINAWEVKMVHALVRHVVRQGVYSSRDIAVLTPYTGQLQRLRAAMRNDFEIILSDRDQDALLKDGYNVTEPSSEQSAFEQRNKRKPLEKKQLSDLLRIATVDNFQGEEAKIIIISLVRSNEQRKVGFLKTTNRINVLLSRAEHGMYIIGNTETYSNVPMWQKVIDLLQHKGSLGQCLGLCCPRHTDTAIKVQQPEDFTKFSPEGGCREACIDRLPDCGHRCQARCHSQAMHEVFRCEQPCQRNHSPCGHPCQKQTCGEDCGKCMVSLSGVKLPCGHLKDGLPCHSRQNLDTVQCDVIVDKVFAGCNHTVQVQCWQSVDEPAYRCEHLCKTSLDCGHLCPGTCGGCIEIKQGQRVVEHQICKKVCGRRFGTCNHTCTKLCHDGSDCGMCVQQCEVECKHSRCTLKCHEACAPCIEPCTWSCPHEGGCAMPCAAPCDRLPCNKRCTETLPCGHQCPGLCREDCLPNYCQACDMKLDDQVDMVELKEYRNIDLDETPVLALACGHFFTAETLDGLIGLNQVYKIDPATGNILGLEDISSELSPAIPKCPHCQRPIRQYATQRYNRLINRAVIDEMSKRFLVTGQTELQDIKAGLEMLEADLENSATGASSTHQADGRPKALENLTFAAKLKTRYTASAQIRSAIVKLQSRVNKRHEPAYKLEDAITHAKRRKASLQNMLEGLNLEPPAAPGERNQRISLEAKLLEFKFDCIVMEDKFKLLQSEKSTNDDSAVNLLSTPFRRFLESCADFFVKCKENALPKIAVEVSVCYSRVAYVFERLGQTKPSDRETATAFREKAKEILSAAAGLCKQEFQGADVLSEVVNRMLELLQREWYEEVSKEELKAIKKAMVSGPGGISTHSGHWYNCANGHPFAIGECGMPMERARCPECGAPVGGQNHQAVEGVTRAGEMEH